MYRKPRKQHSLSVQNRKPTQRKNKKRAQLHHNNTITARHTCNNSRANRSSAPKKEAPTATAETLTAKETNSTRHRNICTTAKNRSIE